MTQEEIFQMEFTKARARLYKVCIEDLDSDNPSTLHNAEYGLEVTDTESGNCTDLGRACLRTAPLPVRNLDYWAAQEAARIVLYNGGGGFINSVFYDPYKNSLKNED